MKKAIVTLLFFLTVALKGVMAQEMGLSFSYFIPKDGYFSTPISPFSLRGVGFDMGKYLSLESGFSLYRMSGMRIKDVPFESPEPFAGPFFSLFVPVELTFNMYFNNQSFHLKGGGFAFYNFDTKLMEGNIDRAIRDYRDWALVNSDFEIDNNIGYGWMVGAEYIFYVNSKFGINLEANYLSGDATANLRGSYAGMASTSGSIEEVEAEYPDSAIDFTGWEFSLGILFNTGR